MSKPESPTNKKTPCLLLPCHSLEDFPTYLTGSDAEQILTLWTVLWHPGILSTCGKIPAWHSDDQVPPQIEGQLFLVPNLVDREMDPVLRESLEEEGGQFEDLPNDRVEAQEKLLRLLCVETSDRFSREVVQKFYSLSYTFLQVELICRQLRYSDGVDFEDFQDQVMKAVHHAQAGDQSALQETLFRCYDLLGDQRQRFYPADPLFTDLTLYAATGKEQITSLDHGLAKQASQWPRFTLQSNASFLSAFQKKLPEEFQSLVKRVEAGEVELVSPGWIDLPNNFSSAETVLLNVKAGNRWLEENVGSQARVYSQRTMGLDNHLPGLLAASGFKGALFQSFDGLRPPNPGETSFRWEGSDGSMLLAIGKQSIDAALASSFLKLGTYVGQTLDEDHLAAIQLAHWPGQVSPFYWDFIGSLQQSSALGRMCTLHEVTENLHDPGYCQLDPTQRYPSWLLRNLRKVFQGESGLSDQRLDDSLRSIRNHFKWKRSRVQRGLLRCMLGMLGESSDGETDAKKTDMNGEHIQRESIQGEDAASIVEGCLNTSVEAAEEFSLGWLSDQLFQYQKAVDGGLEPGGWNFNELAKRFVRKVAPGFQTVSSAAEATHFAWVNPSPFPSSSAPFNEAIVESIQEAASFVPSGGFLIQGLEQTDTASKQSRSSRRRKLIVNESESTLNNQLLDVAIDPNTGAVRSFRFGGKRENRLSWQLAFFDRMVAKNANSWLRKAVEGESGGGILGMIGKGKPSDLQRQMMAHKFGFTQMVCNELKVERNDQELGAIRTSGHLTILGQPIAAYEISYRLQREAKELAILGKVKWVDDDFSVDLEGEPFYQYASGQRAGSRFLCGRIASSASRIIANQNGFLIPTENELVFSPEFYSLNCSGDRVTVVSDQSMVHRSRRAGQVESVIGFSCRPEIRFQKKIAIGYASGESLAFENSQPIMIPGKLSSKSPAGESQSGWLFQKTNPLVRVADWENACLQADEKGPSRLRGVNLLVSNQSSQQQSTRLEFAKQVRSFEVTGADELIDSQAKIDGAGLSLLLMGYETLQVKIRF